MKDFEDQLREALARKPAPDGFAGRVIARSRRKSSWKTWAAGAVAASLVAGVLTVKQVEAVKEREQGQAARAQLLRAFEITRTKVKQIEGKVETVNP